MKTMSIFDRISVRRKRRTRLGTTHSIVHWGKKQKKKKKGKKERIQLSRGS